MHDSSWRSTYGGTIYRSNGSHGCINLPPAAAKTIFENIEQGVPVLCYHLGGTEQTSSTNLSGNKVSDQDVVPEPEPEIPLPPEDGTLPSDTQPSPENENPVPETQLPADSEVPAPEAQLPADDGVPVPETELSAG